MRRIACPEETEASAVSYARLKRARVLYATLTALRLTRLAGGYAVEGTNSPTHGSYDVGSGGHPAPSDYSLKW